MDYEHGVMRRADSLSDSQSVCLTLCLSVFGSNCACSLPLSHCGLSRALNSFIMSPHRHRGIPPCTNERTGTAARSTQSYPELELELGL